MSDFNIKVATAAEAHFAEKICQQMEISAAARGTGIAKRSVSYISNKMVKEEAFIILKGPLLAGFCYLESWSHERFIANSGLIILPEYRGYGLATALKIFAFEESRKRYPRAKLFGLTTSHIVMNINSDLQYRPVVYSQLTDSKEFWDGCRSCVNFETLKKKEFQNCLCTAMLFDPDRKIKKKIENHESSPSSEPYGAE